MLRLRRPSQQLCWRAVQAWALLALQGSRCACSARTVVALDVHDKGVVEFTRFGAVASALDHNRSRTQPDDFKWELYNVAEDYSQANDLAAKNPDKLKEPQAVFDAEAKKYNVYPLDSTFAERVDPAIRPSLTRGCTVFTYYPGMVRIPEGTAPDVKNESYSVTAEVEIPVIGSEGVLATQGGRFGGWGLLVLDGKPVFVHALSNQARHKYRIASDRKLSPGKHTIRFDFAYDGGGIGRGGSGILSVDGQTVAEGKIERTIGRRFSLDETFDVGEDTGTPVVDDYTDKMPFRFTGKLDKLTIELHPDAVGSRALQ
jgi:hypothetical protein